MTPRIVLTTSSPLLETEIREAFDPPLNGELRSAPVASADDAVDEVAVGLLEGEPAVVAFGPDWPIEHSLTVAAAITDQRPEVGILLIANLTSRLWERALTAGVRAVVEPGAAGEELRAALERVCELAMKTRANLGAAGAASSAGRLLCVLSPKGGSGKTMLATNLAVVLSATSPGGVALVDLDLQFGDIATALQLIPEHTIASLTSTAKADATGVKVLLSRYSPVMHVLCAPHSPIEAEDVSCERVGEALDVLAGGFPYTIVDTGAGLDEYALAAVERATDLVLVCSTDVGSVRALRKELDVLDRLGMNGARRRVVLNRSDARVGLTAQDIEATLGMRVDALIPSSRSVPLTMNRGVPIVEAEPRSGVTKGIAAVATQFLGANTTSPAAERPRLWGRQPS